MPTEVLPITDLASLGVIQDTPSFSLPPNAFSDVQNVRFRDGAVRKMTGEELLLEQIPLADRPSDEGDIRYVAYWPSPSGPRYVVVDDYFIRVWDLAMDPVELVAHRIHPNGATPNPERDWQHTLFNGGFHFILNSGAETPYYITDDMNSPSVATLPGWASYAVEERVSDFIYDGEVGDFTIEDDRLVDGASIRIEVTPRNVSAPIRTTVLTINGTELLPDGTVVGLGTTSINGTTLTFTPAASNGGAAIRITVSTAPITGVTAGVIRAYGNLLVAGNLRENGPGSRTLTGTIRTSDVAGPGEIPRNWNPFRLGVNTADEFTLASTGTIQDLVELQGNLYVYTDRSIHAIQQTGSPVIPFQITPVTENYGADNTGAVLEVDGKHIVVGSSDVYVFSGHPGSIQSISDQRVRHRDFFNDGREVRIIRFSRYDELWFWSPNGMMVDPNDSSRMIRDPDMFIWNYRDNTWTIREQTTPTAGNMGQNSPVFVNSDDDIYSTDSTNYTRISRNSDGTLVPIPYDSYVERQKVAVTPEFDVESLASMAFLVSGNGQLDIRVTGTNNSGGTPTNFDTETRYAGGLFDISTEYKQDIREHGRFLNYRMTHVPEAGDIGFSMTGFQFDIGKGGTR